MIKTTSLQTSKMLKENGFRQDSHFCFRKNQVSKEWVISMQRPEMAKFYAYHAKDMAEWYAAFTSDEMLEELPDEYDKGSLAMTKKSVYYEIYEPYEPAYIKHCFAGENLVEALAQMWLHLRKEGLI